MSSEGRTEINAATPLEAVSGHGRVRADPSDATLTQGMERLSEWVDRLGFGVVLLTLALLPFNGYSSEICRGSVFLAIFIWALHCALRREIRLPFSGPHAVLLVYLGLGIVQFLPLPFAVHALQGVPSVIQSDAGVRTWHWLSIDPPATREAVSNLAGLVGLFFAITYFVYSERRLRLTAHWVVLIGVAIAIAGIFTEFTPEQETIWAGSRFGFYFKPSLYVAFLEMVVGLILGLVVAGGITRDRTFLYGFFIVLIGTDIIVSRSRGGIMVLMLQFALLLVLTPSFRPRHGTTESNKWSRARTIVGGLVIAAGIVAGVVWIGSEPVRSKLARTSLEVEAFQRPQELPTSRAAMWRNSLSLLAHYPVFGAGLGTFPSAYPRYDKASGAFLVAEVHNDFLQVLCDSGAAGGILGFFFLYYLWRSCGQASRAQSDFSRALGLGAALAVWGVLAHSLVDFYLQTTANAALFLVILGLLMTVSGQDERLTGAPALERG